MVLPDRAVALALLALTPLQAAATPEAAPASELETPDPDGDIVVVATRLRGEVETAVPPVITLSEDDIAAYGAGSLQPLPAALAPQKGPGRGRSDGAPPGLPHLSLIPIRPAPPIDTCGHLGDP